MGNGTPSQTYVKRTRLLQTVPIIVASTFEAREIVPGLNIENRLDNKMIIICEGHSADKEVSDQLANPQSGEGLCLKTFMEFVGFVR